MNHGISFLIGAVLGAMTGVGVTYYVMNKRAENDMNELVNKVRSDYEKEMDAIVKDLHKEGPGASKKESSGSNISPEQRREEMEFLRSWYEGRQEEKAAKKKEEEENVEIAHFEEPEHGPGQDPDDPDAVYPITETELNKFIDKYGDPEDLLYSADGELHFNDFREFDSPYVFDGVDIEGTFGKYNADPSIALFFDPVSKISYRIWKSLKTDEEMEELAQEGIE